jgi:hypothetical protein
MRNWPAAHRVQVAPASVRLHAIQPNPTSELGQVQLPSSSMHVKGARHSRPKFVSPTATRPVPLQEAAHSPSMRYLAFRQRTHVILRSSQRKQSPVVSQAGTWGGLVVEVGCGAVVVVVVVSVVVEVTALDVVEVVGVGTPVRISIPLMVALRNPAGDRKAMSRSPSVVDAFTASAAAVAQPNRWERSRSLITAMSCNTDNYDSHDNGPSLLPRLPQ